MKRVVKWLLVFVALLVASSAAPAAAQLACSERTAIVETLAARYNESHAGYGLANDGKVLELFVSREGGWTLVLSLPEGPSCIVAAGEAWQMVPLQAAGQMSRLDEAPGRAR
jgi:hypothetical protein